MNRNNKESLLIRCKSKAAHLALVGGMALAPFAAIAGGSGAPDVSEVNTEIALYKTAAIGLAIAFAVVLWAIRGTSLLKPK